MKTGLRGGESKDGSITNSTTREQLASALDEHLRNECKTCRRWGYLITAGGVIEEYDGVSAKGMEKALMTFNQLTGDGSVTRVMEEPETCEECGGSGEQGKEGQK